VASLKKPMEGGKEGVLDASGKVGRRGGREGGRGVVHPPFSRGGAVDLDVDDEEGDVGAVGLEGGREGGRKGGRGGGRRGELGEDLGSGAETGEPF